MIEYQFKTFFMDKKILNLKEAAAFTGLSTATMYKLTHEKKIPFSKPGGKVIYFRLEDLEAWMLSAPILCKSQIESKAASIELNKR